MGDYYDWIEGRWEPIDHARTLTPRTRRQITRRKTLIDHLVIEIEEGGDAVTRLYAQLLARTLVKTDEVLMRECGRRIAAMSGERQAADERDHPIVQTPHRWSRGW
jgi:hypothetical protein